MSPFGHKWTFSVPGITIHKPVATIKRSSINLVTKQIHNSGIVKCNPRCIYNPLVPKQDSFMFLTVHLWSQMQVRYFSSRFWSQNVFILVWNTVCMMRISSSKYLKISGDIFWTSVPVWNFRIHRQSCVPLYTTHNTSTFCQKACTQYSPH